MTKWSKNSVRLKFHFWFFNFFIQVFFAIFFFQLDGAEPKTDKADTPSKMHQRTEENLLELTQNLNQWASLNERPSTEVDYHLNLGILTGYDTRQDLKLHPDIQLKLVLPGFKKHVRLILNSSNRSSKQSGFNYWRRYSQSNSESAQIGTKGLGLEVGLLEKGDFSLVAQEYIQLRIAKWPNPVSRLLLQARHKWKNHSIEWQLGPHWDPDRGFGSLFEPSFRARLSHYSFLQVYSSVQWWHPDRYFKEESVSVIGAIDTKRAIYIDHTYKYEVAPYKSGDFIYSVGYRQRLGYPWLTGQFTPALILDGQKEWKPVYRVALGLQVSFGSKYSEITDFLNF